MALSKEIATCYLDSIGIPISKTHGRLAAFPGFVKTVRNYARALSANPGAAKPATLNRLDIWFIREAVQCGRQSIVVAERNRFDEATGLIDQFRDLKASLKDPLLALLLQSCRQIAVDSVRSAECRYSAHTMYEMPADESPHLIFHVDPDFAGRP